MQDEPMYFNVIQHQKKFIDMVLDFTMQLTFKKLLLVKFGLSIEDYMRPYFLHISQPKQHKTD